MKVQLECTRCGRPMRSTGIRGMCPACLFACTTGELGETDSAAEGRELEGEAETLDFGMSVGPGGRYRLLDKLGEGGMGEVWLAHDEELSQAGEAQMVALKFLSKRIEHDPLALTALRAEVLRSHRLSHPNIVRIYDLHTRRAGTPFIAMEYVEGNSLRQWLEERELAGGTMPWQMVVQVAQQLASALRYAHETEGIIHRDLKPGNILMREGPVVKLSDFGIAMAMQPGAKEEVPAMGTLWYASPQQLAGQAPRPEDDIYSLGATLYELLTGSLPLDARTAEALIHKVHQEKPDSIPGRLRSLNRRNDVPPKLANIVQRCLEKDPFERPKIQEIIRSLPAASEGLLSPRSEQVSSDYGKKSLLPRVETGVGYFLWRLPAYWARPGGRIGAASASGWGNSGKRAPESLKRT